MRPHLVIPFGLVGAAANHLVVVTTGGADDPAFVSPARVFAWCVGFAVAALLGRVVQIGGARPMLALLGAVPACAIALALDRGAGDFGPPRDVSAVGVGLAAALVAGPVLAMLTHLSREGELAREGSEVRATAQRTKWMLATSLVLGAAAYGRASPMLLMLVAAPVYLHLVVLAVGTLPALVDLRRLSRARLAPASGALEGLTAEPLAPRVAPRPRLIDAGFGDGALALVERVGTAYRDPEVISTVVRGDLRVAIRALSRALAIQLTAGALSCALAASTVF